MKVFAFFRKFALPCSLVLGALGYLIFANVPFLQPLGDAVGPRLVELMPVVLFALLYVTFCKIEIKEMKPKAWHFVLQLIRTSLALPSEQGKANFLKNENTFIIRTCFNEKKKILLGQPRLTSRGFFNSIYIKAIA